MLKNISIAIGKLAYRETLENTEKRTIQRTDNTGHTRRRKQKPKHNTTRVEHHHTQTNTDNAHKTCNTTKTTEVKTNRKDRVQDFD